MTQELLDPEETPVAGNSRKRITCEFCECVLLPTGEHTGLSPKAKEMRDASQRNEKLSAQVETQGAEIASLKQQLETAKKQPEQTKTSKFSFAR
jgi:hypothetical protein